jgi:ATP-dependent RNA helicase HelY
MVSGERAAVLSVAYRRGGAVRVRLVDDDANVLSIGPSDVEVAPISIATVELPVPFTPNNATMQREVADRLRRVRARKVGGRRTGADPGPGGRPHGKEFAILDHLERAERDIAEFDARVRSQSTSIARRFEDVLSLLQHWGYVDGWSLTSRGAQLVRIFCESDLLVAEALARGIFDGLDAATLAGLVSCVTYEHRSAIPSAAPWFPSASVRARFDALRALVDELNALEIARRLPVTRSVDAGFFALAYAWASGDGLETVLDDEEVSGGEFVRNIRQMLDLLRQIAETATDPDTSATARRAGEALQRGVVLASNAVGVPLVLTEAETITPAPVIELP